MPQIRWQKILIGAMALGLALLLARYERHIGAGDALSPLTPPGHSPLPTPAPPEDRIVFTNTASNETPIVGHILTFTLQFYTTSVQTQTVHVRVTNPNPAPSYLKIITAPATIGGGAWYSPTIGGQGHGGSAVDGIVWEGEFGPGTIPDAVTFQVQASGLPTTSLSIGYPLTNTATMIDLAGTLPDGTAEAAIRIMPRRLFLPAIIKAFAPWPPPLAEPGSSKLGLHVIQTNSPDIVEFIRRAKPAVVKAVGGTHWLSEVKEVSPETVTIGRLMGYDDEGNMTGDPEKAAQDFVVHYLEEYLLNPGVDYWEGWNEPLPTSRMAWYARFEAERTRLMAEHGLRVAVGGFATGTPEWDEFAEFLPAIEVALAHDGILALHEYAAPTLDYRVGEALPGHPAYPERGVLTLRYRWWYEDFLKPRGLAIPLVISEGGIDGQVQQDLAPPGLGWRDFTDYWAQQGLGKGGSQAYIQQLAWYDGQLQQDDYVIGMAIFTAGSPSGQWLSFDITDILRSLANYVVSQK